MNTSTDDFLCVCTSYEAIFSSLNQHVVKYVNVTVQTGSILNYLNLRIIQSEHGISISIDQTQHIKDSILDVWFPQDENVNAAYTPIRTDSKFETDLVEVLLSSAGSNLPSVLASSLCPS